MKYEEAKEVERQQNMMNLRQKLACIREDIHNVDKTGWNDFSKYKYVEASEIQGLIGTALAKHNIALGRRNVAVERGCFDGDKKKYWFMVQCEYGLLDADSGEELWYGSAGEAHDTGDKASYKAWTGCFKYFLIQAFSLAMGDDPEDDGTQKKFDAVVDSGALAKLMGKEAEGKKEVEEKVGKAQDAPEGGAEAPTRSETISPADINDMLAALTSAAGIWGTDYVAGCLKTWAARPVPNIERLGQDGAVDVALIDSLTENDHQVSKFHGRLAKLQKAVENARGAGA